MLEILYKLLRDHEVTEEDFREEVMELPDGSTVTASKPPGFTLLLHMLNDSPLFKMVRGGARLVFLCRIFVVLSSCLGLSGLVLLWSCSVFGAVMVVLVCVGLLWSCWSV